MRTLGMMKRALHGVAMATLLTAGLAMPAHAENKDIDFKPPQELTDVEKRIDLNSPPPEAAKDPAVNTADEVMNEDGGVSTKAKVNCGIVTCSLYLSKKETHFVGHNGIVAAVAANMIPTIGGLLGIAHRVVNWKARQAAQKHQCLRVRFTPGGIVGLYSDGSKFCK
jgi:hypothetical protein